MKQQRSSTLPNAQQKPIFQWLGHHIPKPVCNGVIYRAIGAFIRHQGQLAGIRPGHRLSIPCISCNVMHPSRVGCYTRDIAVVAFRPCPFHAIFLNTVRSYFCPPYGNHSLHCQQCGARIGIAAATVVYCDLLYNQSLSVENMRMEMPISTIKS